MTNQHPIIPPKGLVRDWHCSLECPDGANAKANYLCAKAAQWGADAELEACVEWLGDAPVVYNDNGDLHPGSYLRDARRPKPPSLKESALNALEHILRHSQTDHGASTIRRALEALDD